MNAKPRRFLSGISADLEGEYHGDIKTLYGPPGTIVIECEIQQPPSSKGRTIYVYFQGDDVTDVLKILRDEAIRVRSQPLEAAE